MNRDIDIREHAVIIKFDRGHEEVQHKALDIGENADGQQMRIVIQRDAKDRITKIKVQNL